MTVSQIFVFSENDSEKSTEITFNPRKAANSTRRQEATARQIILESDSDDSTHLSDDLDCSQVINFYYNCRLNS